MGRYVRSSMHLATTFPYPLIGSLRVAGHRQVVQIIDARVSPSGGCGTTDLWTRAIHPNRLGGVATQDLVRSSGEHKTGDQPDL